MPLNQLSNRINVEVMPEQWSSSLTAIGWWFWEVLDGTGRNPLNLAYTCVVRMTRRLQYITWKNALKAGRGTLIQFLSWRKPYKTKNLVCFEDKFDNLICVKPSWIVKFNRFSSEINLVLLSTLYKFIIWAVRVWAQSGFGINTISVLTIGAVYGKSLI